jgi:signal transduction histidine kinase
MTHASKSEDIRERLERLVRAGIRISEGHSLEVVLQQIADSARDVTGGRYAALGIVDQTGEGLAQFIASGLTTEEHRRIGNLPQGRGLLGLLIREPRPIRISDIARHPATAGFPPHHPPMRSFLGVPVVGRHGPIGNLYITEKIGAEAFSEDDEALAVMLAAQAAVAVENARLLDESNRLLEEVRGLQRSRDRFYAMINHELRNALTAVFGWSELLIRRQGPEAPQAALEVHDSAERTLRLLNDLLDLSRLDASKLTPVVREVDLQLIVWDALQTARPAAQARGVEILVGAPSERVGLRTDPQRMGQILINLLSNAVRHSPVPGVVRVDAAATDERVTVSVSDQGEGISAEQQATIFEAFVRGGSDDSRGTGLGLTLSLQLARLLGGDLRVSSQPGSGARFTLEIPRFLAGA